MHIFFVSGYGMVAPPLSGSILPGLTRDSVLTIVRDWGMNVSEGRSGMEGLRRASADGALREVFGTGTAAVISPVGELRYRGENVVVNGGASGEISRRLFDEISGIQYGGIFDRYGWVHRVE